MPLEAVPIDNDEWPEELRVTTSGAVGRRHFLVNTRQRDLALTAPGMPPIGQSWSVLYPLLRVVEYETAAWAGGKDDVTGTGGHLVVPVLYETPNFRASNETNLDDYTEIETESQNSKIYYAVGAAEGGIVLANGEGTDKAIGITKFRVVKYLEPEQVTIGYQQKLIDFHERQVVNSQPVTLPPLRGTNVVFIAGTSPPDIAVQYEPADAVRGGQARFLDYSMEPVGGKVRVTIVLGMRRSHLLLFGASGRNGLLGALIAAQIYEVGDLNEVINP